MSKHSSAAYSLWPEQVRRRRSMSLTFAVSGFVFGLVCVTMAYNVISGFGSSAALDELSRSSELGGTSIISPPGAPAVAQSWSPKSANSIDRARTRAAKVTLPIIGTEAVQSAETDGRNIDTAAEPENRVSMIPEDAASAPPALESGTDGTKPVAADERPIKPRTNAIRTGRASSRYAAQARHRPGRSRSYAAANRGERSVPSGVVSQTASWY